MSSAHASTAYNAIIDAINLADSLIDAKLFEEARSLLRDMIPTARRLGRYDNAFSLLSNYARAIYRDTNSSLGDLIDAVSVSEDVLHKARQVFGTQHPLFARYRKNLENARMRLADDESRQAFTDAAPAPTTRRRRRRRRAPSSK